MMAETLPPIEQVKSELNAKKILLDQLLSTRQLNEFASDEMIEESAKLVREIQDLERLLGLQKES